jgi:hypothetical protein
MGKLHVATLVVILAGWFSGGVPVAGGEAEPGFQRVFAWANLKDEEIARRLSQVGVTDVRVSNELQRDLALRFGMRPYVGVFAPRGPHRQVMSPQEEEHWAYINGQDLSGVSREQKRDEMDRRRLERQHRYGGEPDAELDTLNDDRIACFASDEGYQQSKAALDTLLAKVPGVAGVFFDYIGYTNFKGCHCEHCLAAYQAHLEAEHLTDTPANRDAFHRDRLVTYINAMVDQVKATHPDYQVVIHIYPTFLPEPLYGNRTKADFCGQTVAWFFPWDQDKIARYTRAVIGEQNRYFPVVRGVPFVGLNRGPGSLWVKDAATLERELATIRAAGTDMLMVCDGNDMIEPGLAQVFRKYCGGAADAKSSVGVRE